MHLSRPLKQGIAFSLAVHAVLFLWLWSLEGARLVFPSEPGSAEVPEEVPVTFFVQAPPSARATPPPAPSPRALKAPSTRGPPDAPQQPPHGSNSQVPREPTGGLGAMVDIPRLSAGLPSAPGPLALLPRVGLPVEESPSSVAGGISRMSSHSLDRMQRLLPGELTREANEAKALFTPEARTLAMTHSVEAIAAGRMRPPPGGNRADTPAALQAQQAPGPSGAVDLQRSITSLATLRSFSEGAATPTWSLQLELLRTGPELRVSLHRASRFPALDVMVQQRTRLWVAERQRQDPDFMEGIRRALWQVEAFVHYRQDLAGSSAGDLAGLIATVPVSGLGKGRSADEGESLESRILGLALTLNVDETTGKTEVINLGSPQYRLEMRLLESELESRDGGA